jgi:hypothetical protein
MVISVIKLGSYMGFLIAAHFSAIARASRVHLVQKQYKYFVSLCVSQKNIIEMLLSFV